MLNRLIPLALSASLLASSTAPAIEPVKDTPQQHDERMEWWREARFGMFIHWGLYSAAAGYFHDKADKGAGEWIMNGSKITIADYSELMSQFNPDKFDAKEWAKVAKDAGMKYLVITSKHHDGFCMWPSEQTEWCIKSTPWYQRTHRDVLKELSEACKEAGIRFCLYYSIMDWHHQDYDPHRAWHAAEQPQPPDMNKYVAYMKAQLKELVENYHPGVIWFDGSWEGTWTPERGTDLLNYLRELDPKLIVNNRVGKHHNKEGHDTQDVLGDYTTPEQRIPKNALGIDWETCMTMNGTWGYKKDDNHWKSTETLVRNLIDITSKGGNYLLNVGPTSEGEIPQASVERLEEMGKWMKVNGQAIYGAKGVAFGEPVKWGRATQKPGKLFLEVFDWPSDGKLLVPVKNRASKATLLTEPATALKAETGDDGLAIELPKSAPDKIASVVEADISGALEPLPSPAKADKETEQTDGAKKQ
jgi:alpha-L-fucosidase